MLNHLLNNTVKQARRLSIKTLLLTLLVIAWLSFSLGVAKVGSIVWGDAHYYFALTRSLVVEQNLDLSFEMGRVQAELPNLPTVSSLTGKVTLPFSPGTSIFWIPGFIDGQIASWLINSFGADLSLDGYSWVTQLVMGYWAIGFCMLGLGLMIETWQVLFGKSRQWLWLGLVILFCSPLFFYTFIDPLNSHTLEFLFSAAAAYLFSKILKQQNWKLTDVLFLGTAAAALGLVRNQDWLLLLPLSAAIFFLSKPKNRIQNFLVLILPSLLFIFLQLVITHYYFGRWGSPYSLAGHHLSLMHPDFLRIWFSPANGFFFFAPIFLLAIYGNIKSLNDSNRQEKIISAISLIFFSFQSWIIAAWMPEVLGGPYGSRMFIGTIPWLGFGLIWWFRHLTKLTNLHKTGIKFFVLLLIFWNFAQTAYMLWKW